jgi:tetratricopeptide (TPR) repeat protein
MLASIYMKEGDTANGTKYLRLGAKYNNIDMKPIEGPYNIPDRAFTESGNSIEALVTIQAKVESVIGAGMKAKSDADPDAAPKNIIEEAIAIRKNGNPRDSIKKLEKLMHRYPDDQSIRLQLGWCYFDLKEYNNAKQFFKQSLNYFVSPLMIGWCYDELKEHQKAVDWFTYYNRPTKWCKNVEKKDPSLVAKSFVRASQIFYNYRNYDKGVKWSKKSVTLHPSNHGYWVLGMNHYQMKDYKEAVVAFENALRLDPNNKAYQKDLKRAKRKAKTFGLF